MKRKLEVSEYIFKIISYTLLTVFALACLYPFVYAVSSSISGKDAVALGQVVLFPKDVEFKAFSYVFSSNAFWTRYSNTLFITFYGMLWALGVSILGAYALSKKRLLFRKGFNFFLVFTMWFSAGIVPQYLNYLHTRQFFDSISLSGVSDDKWLIVIAMGMAAFNIILLRNSFESVPAEIEEAARVDGATELQVLKNVYLPMTKSTVATVALFFGISRWNGYYWAKQMSRNETEPLQVFIRDFIDTYLRGKSDDLFHPGRGYAPGEIAVESVVYAMIVCAIVPILIIYPFIQKYFAKGVNVGGVKE